MTRWMRFEYKGNEEFGSLTENMINIFEGDMFEMPQKTGKQVQLSEVKILTPTTPSKMPALWNNYHTMAEKAGNSKPTHPLYFFKPPNCFAASGETIFRPKGYAGKIVYEGEIGIVLGRKCKNANKEEATDAIFGFTCINDITASEIINSDNSFAQWTRSKGFDGFGSFGPVVATGLNSNELKVLTILNGEERQNYKVSDMIIPPIEIVRLLSWDMTLNPGDVICCGTNVGVGSMKEPSNKVEVKIDGIGTLLNTFEN